MIENKSILTETSNEVLNKCYHCGDKIKTLFSFDDKNFCCSGCRTVYEILNTNELCQYYDLNSEPGRGINKSISNSDYSYLDDADTLSKLINFTDGKITTITFYLPQIHCSSCIWLLENLYKIEPGILQSEVNFLRKEIFIKFDATKLSLSKIAKLLDRLGYEPKINFSDLEKEKSPHINRPYFYRIGVAFFAFGNIMLLSFPEYFGLNILAESNMRQFFGYINFLLALPVFFYSSSIFFKSAYSGLKSKTLNLDFPIVLGIIIMFVRSSYEIFSGAGSGFMDTLASLVFLMLVGRLFQNKTYEHISYDRDYKSYFPLSVNLIKAGKETSTNIGDLNTGDRIAIRNQEIIPADSILMSQNAVIDYSFVTGESNPVEILKGELVFAGGKNIGQKIELDIVKAVSNSYLTKLWNNEVFRKSDETGLTNLATRVSKWFTAIVLFIAFGSLFYWGITGNIARGINAFTAVLIITCPCALALSTPFTLGNALRVFGRNRFFLKNGLAIEKLNKIDSIVFDKTGTLTTNKNKEIIYSGSEIDTELKKKLFAVISQSNHPLSKQLSDYLFIENTHINLNEYDEIPGRGIKARIEDLNILIGSSSLMKEELDIELESIETTVFIAINNEVLGRFDFKNSFRNSIKQFISNLKSDYKLYLLSGDNDKEKENLGVLFESEENLHFNQSPEDKLGFIKQLQGDGKKPMMVGDGLNDAGALKQSFLGIAVSEDVNNFSPACDAILDSEKFEFLPKYIKFAQFSYKIIIISFLISFCYNSIGTYFAVQGTLSPLFAAIIMPISSVSIILFTTLSINIRAKMEGL